MTGQLGTNNRSTFQVAGSSSFLGPRNGRCSFIPKDNEDPGPGEYKPDKSIDVLKMKKGDKSIQGFRSNIDRFKVADQMVPAPGSYKHDSSMIIKPGGVSSAYKSATKRELKLVIDKGNSMIPKFLDRHPWQWCI